MKLKNKRNGDVLAFNLKRQFKIIEAPAIDVTIIIKTLDKNFG